MSYVVTAMFMLIPPIAIFAAVYAALKAVKRGVGPSRAFGRHILTLIVATAVLTSLTVAVSAATDATAPDVSADAYAETETAASDTGVNGLGLMSAALCTGLAGIGGGIALASGAPAAIGATAEDPKNFSKSLIFVALGETIALYGVVISVMILSKI